MNSLHILTKILEDFFAGYIKEKTKKIELIEEDDIKRFNNLISETANNLRKSQILITRCGVYHPQ